MTSAERGASLDGREDVLLAQDRIQGLHGEALSAGLANRRNVLMKGLPEAFIASLSTEGDASAQLLSDLSGLNREPFEDGRHPLVIWLGNALSLVRASQLSRHVSLFENLLSELGAPPCPPPRRSNRRTGPIIANPAQRVGESFPPTEVITPSGSVMPNPFPVSSNPVYRRFVDLPDLPPPPKYAQHHFVGRTAELSRLHDALLVPSAANQTLTRVAAVFGLGGMGKTAIAQVFAERYSSNFQGGILWGDFGSDDGARAVLDLGIERWEASLEIQGMEKDERAPKKRIDRMKKALIERVRAKGPCLAILDNIDDEKTLDALLEMLVACSVLVTTRVRELVDKEQFTLVELGGLRPEESEEYLKKVLGPDPGEERLKNAQEACRHVDYHPLSLRVIAAAAKAGSAGSVQLIRRLARSARDVVVPVDKSHVVQVPRSSFDCFHGAVTGLRPADRTFLIAMASQHVGSWSAAAARYISGMRDEDGTRLKLEALHKQGLIDHVGDGRYKLHRVLRHHLRSVHGRSGLFGLVPTTWEIASLAPILRRVAPSINAGQVVYDLRQEQWAMELVEEHQGKPTELAREWGAILLGLRRRAERGFGAAARQRLEMLKDVLPFADLSRLPLQTAALDGVNLMRVHLQRADLSGEPLRDLPTKKRVREAFLSALKGTVLFAAAMAVALAIYAVQKSFTADLRWAVFLPAPLAGAMGPSAALLLSFGRIQKHLDRISMRWRFAIERATEIALFSLGGVAVLLPIAIAFRRPELIATFALITLQFAVPFAFVSWLTFRLTRWAGRRFTLGGLASRLLFGGQMALLVFISPLAIARFFTSLPDADLLSSLWLTVFTLIVGMLSSPERHLLTSLRTSYLRGANMRGADLTEAKLDHVQLSEAILHNAELDRASLRGANLDGAHLDGASLAGANLENASLRGADLTEVDLTGANLHGADLSGAKLARATLTRVKHDKSTAWPDSVRVSDSGEVLTGRPSGAEGTDPTPQISPVAPSNGHARPAPRSPMATTWKSEDMAPPVARRWRSRSATARFGSS